MSSKISQKHHPSTSPKPHQQHQGHSKTSTSNLPARKILVAFLLNLGFSIFEFIGGAFTHSIAITSDAIHDLGDAASIAIAYGLERLSRKAPDSHYTYGYIRYSCIGSLITTLILLIGSAIVIASAITRIAHPVAVDYDGIIVLAVIGVIVNSIAAYYTHRGHSLNQKSVNLHMLEDVLGWVVVLIGAIVMRFTDISLIDPLLSIGVAAFIFISALQNFRAIVDLFLEKTPRGISIDDLRRHVLALPNVEGVHHIHVWSLDGYQAYATLHVVTSHPSAALKSAIRDQLSEQGISHVTIELEDPSEDCHAHSCQHSVPATHAHHHH